MADLSGMSIEELQNEKRRLELEQEVEKLRGAKGWNKPEDTSLEGRHKRFRTLKQLDAHYQEEFKNKKKK